MGAYPVRRISTATSLDDLARRVRGDVAAYGGAVRVARRPQARQLRRLMAALRADGYRAQYFTDGDQHVLEVGPYGPAPRAVGLVEAIS